MLSQKLNKISPSSAQEKLSTFQRAVQDLLNSIRSRLGKAREAQVREMFYLSDQYVNTRGGMLQDKEFDLITYKGTQLILGEVKTGSVTLAEVLTFANKLEQVREAEEAVGILFVLDTIYPDAFSAASERNIQVWDIARIDEFRKALNLEKLAI